MQAGDSSQAKEFSEKPDYLKVFAPDGGKDTCRYPFLTVISFYVCSF